MNKRMIFVLVAQFTGFGAFAQIQQGRILASGSVGFNSSTYKQEINGTTTYESNSTYLWLMPKTGYFITDEIVVGFGLSLSTGSTKYEDGDKFISSSISFTPFARYYLPQGLFGQLEFGPGSKTNTRKEEDEDDSKYKYGTFLWSLGVGYTYFLNNHVAVEPLVSYTSSTTTEKEFSDYKEKHGDILFQVGFSIYLDAQ